MWRALSNQPWKREIWYERKLTERERERVFRALSRESDCCCCFSPADAVKKAGKTFFCFFRLRRGERRSRRWCIAFPPSYPVATSTSFLFFSKQARARREQGQFHKMLKSEKISQMMFCIVIPYHPLALFLKIRSVDFERVF